MNTSLALSTNFPPLGALLNGDAPDGIRVLFTPPIERRDISVSVNVNFDIQLVIDASKIAAIIFAAWFVRHIRGRGRDIEVRLNGKQIPKDETEAIEFVVREIENQSRGDDQKP